jgi:hypothetical protein
MLVAAVLAVVVVLLGTGLGLVAITADGGGDEVVARASTTTTEADDREDEDTPSTTDEDDVDPTSPPTTEPDSGSMPTQAEVDAVVADISTFVEQERGLPFKEPVTVELLDDDAFEARLLEDFEEGAEELEITEQELKALGLIEPDVDLQEALRSAYGAGVLGFYDPETNELVVRGAELTPYVRETIAHELTHALDDQHFELDRPQYDDADDEVWFGFSALLEGNATRVEDAYVESMSEAEQAERDMEELEFGMDADLFDVPIVVLELLVAPYELGPVLVDELLDDGGQAELDASFADPPTTSEQVLHPDKYQAREGRAEVPPPPAEGEVVDDGVWGEYAWSLLLGEGFETSESSLAAEGWAGDWYVAWEDEGQFCVRIDVVMESSFEADELLAELEYWQSFHPQAVVEPQGDLGARLTSCTESAGGGGGLAP